MYFVQNKLDMMCSEVARGWEWSISVMKITANHRLQQKFESDKALTPAVNFNSIVLSSIVEGARVLIIIVTINYSYS